MSNQKIKGSKTIELRITIMEGWLQKKGGGVGGGWVGGVGLRREKRRR